MALMMATREGRSWIPVGVAGSDDDGILRSNRFA
jgi:hypothetical protein